jgi:uncharacterized membrane protein
MDLAIARIVHVLSIVLWIGGVGFVTTVLLPTLRRNDPATRLRRLDRFEELFARQMRWIVLLAGATGLYMVVRLDLWTRFEAAGFWWMHAMVLTWLAFAAMLFVIEPLGIERRVRAKRDPEAAFRAIERLHRVLLALALITVLGAVAGVHGLSWFG